MRVADGNLLGRRAILAVGVLGALGACARGEDAPSAARPATSGASATPSATPPPVALPAQPAYEALPGEVEPSCKVAAARVLESALTWAPETGGSAGAAARLRSAGQPPAIAADLRSLLGDAVASSLRVVYPQYGGLSAGQTSASVMIAAEQALRPKPGAAVVTRGLTVDVRLTRTGKAWRATSVDVPALPGRAGTSTNAIRNVLGSPNLELPEAARHDVESGVVDDRVLSLLTELASRWKLHVLVLKSGHPRNVFPTDRVSNHTRGLAVDIWKINDVPVIERDRSPWQAVMKAAAALGANEIGGPKDLDRAARGKPYFTNAVHQDHIHLGFDL